MPVCRHREKKSCKPQGMFPCSKHPLESHVLEKSLRAGPGREGKARSLHPSVTTPQRMLCCTAGGKSPCPSELQKRRLKGLHFSGAGGAPISDLSDLQCLGTMAGEARFSQVYGFIRGSQKQVFRSHGVTESEYLWGKGINREAPCLISWGRVYGKACCYHERHCRGKLEHPHTVCLLVSDPRFISTRYLLLKVQRGAGDGQGCLSRYHAHQGGT